MEKSKSPTPARFGEDARPVGPVLQPWNLELVNTPYLVMLRNRCPDLPAARRGTVLRIAERRGTKLSCLPSLFVHSQMQKGWNEGSRGRPCGSRSKYRLLPLQAAGEQEKVGFVEYIPSKYSLYLPSHRRIVFLPPTP